MGTLSELSVTDRFENNYIQFSPTPRELGIGYPEVSGLALLDAPLIPLGRHKLPDDTEVIAYYVDYPINDADLYQLLTVTKSSRSSQNRQDILNDWRRPLYPGRHRELGKSDEWDVLIANLPPLIRVLERTPSYQPWSLYRDLLETDLSSLYDSGLRGNSLKEAAEIKMNLYELGFGTTAENLENLFAAFGHFKQAKSQIMAGVIFDRVNRKVFPESVGPVSETVNEFLLSLGNDPVERAIRLLQVARSGERRQPEAGGTDSVAFDIDGEDWTYTSINDRTVRVENRGFLDFSLSGSDDRGFYAKGDRYVRSLPALLPVLSWVKTGDGRFFLKDPAKLNAYFPEEFEELQQNHPLDLPSLLAGMQLLYYYDDQFRKSYPEEKPFKNTSDERGSGRKQAISQSQVILVPLLEQDRLLNHPLISALENPA